MEEQWVKQPNHSKPSSKESKTQTVLIKDTTVAKEINVQTEISQTRTFDDVVQEGTTNT